MSTYKNANYGINRIGGEGKGSTKGQGIYEESSYAKFDLGEKLELIDGRVFRYGYFGSAVAAGVLVSQDVSATAVVETNNIATAAAIGATEVTLTDSGTLGSATANQYAGGYLHTTDDAGEGYQYRIKSNTAASSNAVTFTLYDSLASPTDYIVSGTTPRSFTSGYYGWVQTDGVATILADGTIAAGNNLTLSDGVNGAVQAKDAETEPLIGFATFAPDDTGHVGVKLQLS